MVIHVHVYQWRIQKIRKLGGGHSSIIAIGYFGSSQSTEIQTHLPTRPSDYVQIKQAYCHIAPRAMCAKNVKPTFLKILNLFLNEMSHSLLPQR